MAVQRPSSSRSLADMFSAAVGQTGPIVEEYRATTDSLDWQLGQHYWNHAGSRAFFRDGVPHWINNDGDLSRACADLLFRNLCERDGPAQGEFFVLELGVGIGLFARLFLDCFQRLCLAAGKDYYDRLTYVAADRYETILQDLCRNGTFSNHPGRYLLRVVDASQPVSALRGDIALARCQDDPFDAVFLNYVLDCLPATWLEVDNRTVNSLCVRTRLSDNEEDFRRAGCDATELMRLARSEDPWERDRLRRVVGLLRFEYGFFAPPVPVPYQDVAVDFARSHNLRHVVHNFGAIQALEGVGSSPEREWLHSRQRL